jgi:hypothetical protein
MHAAGREDAASAAGDLDRAGDGMGGHRDGELLARAEQHFDVLVTADQKLPRQQRLAGSRLAVVVLPTNRVPDVVNLLPDLERALDAIQPGTVVELARSA